MGTRIWDISFTNQIGSETSIRKGRMRLVFNIWEPVSSWSKRHHHRESPVIFCLFLVFCRSKAGAYVSLTRNMRHNETPVHMSTSQLIQRHPRYWYTKPPMMGPNLHSCQLFEKKHEVTWNFRRYEFPHQAQAHSLYPDSSNSMPKHDIDHLLHRSHCPGHLQS